MHWLHIGLLTDSLGTTNASSWTFELFAFYLKGMGSILVWFCGPWILGSSNGFFLIWDITSSPRRVEPPFPKAWYIWSRKKKQLPLVS